MTRFRGLCLSLLLLAFTAATAATAQQQGLFSKKEDKPKFSTPLPYQIFHLTSMTEQNDANEVAAAVRRVIDSDAVTLIGMQNDLMVIGSPEQLTAAAAVIAALDKPRPLYHLSFVVTEIDGTHRAVRHYSLYATGGRATHLKSGSWIPLAPPPAPPAPPAEKADKPGAERYAPAKVEHIETGLYFDVVLDEYTGGVRMQSTIKESSLPTGPLPPGTADPIIEQNEVYNTAILHWGKPILLGVIDPPGTTRHIEIEVTADQQP